MRILPFNTELHFSACKVVAERLEARERLDAVTSD
jgi:hypothetical protein